MSRKKTQAYTEEFRREAVRRADQLDNTAASVARELGIHSGQIYNWRRQFTRLSERQFNSVDGVDYSKAESEAMRKLKREMDTLKKENEFLKKVSAYFAKSQE
jgi:transposase